MKNVLYLRLKRKKLKSLIEGNQQRRERDREWIQVLKKRQKLKNSVMRKKKEVLDLQV